MDEQTVFAGQTPETHCATLGNQTQTTGKARHFLADLDRGRGDRDGGIKWLSLDTDAGTAEDWELLEEHHTAWYDNYESTIPWLATKAELVALARSAPNGFARGVVLGWLLARHDVAAQSGIPFV